MHNEWLAIIEAHAQAHEAWLFAFGLKEKCIMSEHPTKLRDMPVCPHCGHKHRDAWEWSFGPGLEGEIIHDCDSCGEEFRCERDVTIYYSTTKLKDSA